MSLPLNVEVISLVAWRLEARLLKTIASTFGATQSWRKRFACVFRQFWCCCAGGSTSTAASCWRVDGTRIKAVNNKDRNFTRSFAARVLSVCSRPTSGWRTTSSWLDEGDVADGATSGGARTKNRGREGDQAALSEKRGRYQA